MKHRGGKVKKKILIKRTALNLDLNIYLAGNILFDFNFKDYQLIAMLKVWYTYVPNMSSESLDPKVYNFLSYFFRNQLFSFINFIFPKTMTSMWLKLEWSLTTPSLAVLSSSRRSFESTKLSDAFTTVTFSVRDLIHVQFENQRSNNWTLRNSICPVLVFIDYQWRQWNVYLQNKIWPNWNVPEDRSHLHLLLSMWTVSGCFLLFMSNEF